MSDDNPQKSKPARVSLLPPVIVSSSCVYEIYWALKLAAKKPPVDHPAGARARRHFAGLALKRLQQELGADEMKKLELE